MPPPLKARGSNAIPFHSVYEKATRRNPAIKIVAFYQFPPVFSQFSSESLRAAELWIHNAGPFTYNDLFTLFFDVV